MATEEQMVPVCCIRQVLVSLTYPREQRFPSYRSLLLCFVHFASVWSGEEEKEEAHCFLLQFHTSPGAWDSALCRGKDWAWLSQDITVPIHKAWLFFPHPLQGISSNSLQLNHALFAAWLLGLQELPLGWEGKEEERRKCIAAWQLGKRAAHL